MVCIEKSRIFIISQVRAKVCFCAQLKMRRNPVNIKIFERKNTEIKRW